MSGFTVRDGRLMWDVLESKVWRWHDNRQRYGSPCPDSSKCHDAMRDLLDVHLVPAGFTVGEHRSGRAVYLHVEGPGVAEGRGDPIYEAITGQPGRGIGDVDPTALLETHSKAVTSTDRSTRKENP